jgi:hypothetical protein
MTRSPPGALQRVERELERIGLLLEHDKELPSVTLLVAGEPIRGSWWGHALGHAIYDLLHELGERSGKLDAKLVDGKVTYVHPRLWPAFFALAEDDTAARVEKLSGKARELFALVTRGPQRLDLLRREGGGSSKELTAAARELEARVLVHSASLHTESGAHTRVLQTWAAWREASGARIDKPALAAARAELGAAVGALCRGTARAAKTPF